MTYDMNDFDSIIEAMPLAIPALFLMMNDEERAQFRAILESICASYELRKPWFSEWMRAIIAEADAVQARISIERGGADEQRGNNQADS